MRISFNNNFSSEFIFSSIVPCFTLHSFVLFMPLFASFWEFPYHFLYKIIYKVDDLGIWPMFDTLQTRLM